MHRISRRKARGLKRMIHQPKDSAMVQHVTVKPLANGRWAVCGIRRGNVLETHDTEQAARRAILPLSEQTPEDRERRLPTFSDADQLEASNARDAELVRRFREGLPLSLHDKRKARQLAKALPA